MSAVLGELDPLAMPVDVDLADVCGAQSDRPLFASVGFVCTRAPDHVAADPEHVGSASWPETGSIAVGAWTDEHTTPRVLLPHQLARIRAGGKP